MELKIIIYALSIGILTSFHCIGMCGPIAFSLGLQSNNKKKYFIQNLIYQLGRVTTYTIFGGIVGILGEGFNLSGYQNILSIFAGICLILIVILPYFTNYFNSKFTFLDKFLIKLKIILGNYLQKKTTSSKYITGILNGFLPCGAVYIALTASLTSGGILNGMLFMTFFGLGTIPLMFMSVILGNIIGINFRNILLKIYPYFIVLFGIIFILRGLDLNIPYISPHEDSLQLFPKKDCCH